MPSDTKSIGYNNLAMAQTNKKKKKKKKSSGLNLQTTTTAHGVKKENMQFFVAQRETAGKSRVHWETIAKEKPSAAERVPSPGLSARAWSGTAAGPRPHSSPTREHPVRVHPPSCTYPACWKRMRYKTLETAWKS